MNGVRLLRLKSLGVCGGLPAVIGPLLPVASMSVRRWCKGRWLVVALRSALVGCEGSACEGLHARAAAAPPGSGPRSRGTVEARNANPHQNGFAMHWLRTPRMGPAPGGTTATLLRTSVTCHAFACPGAGAGGLGYGRRPPFAVSSTCTRGHGVDGATRARHRECPASAGPENVPRATCPFATSACTTARTAATGPKAVLHTASAFRISRVARHTLEHLT